MADKPKSVDEYLAGLRDDQRAALEVLRKTIGEAAPEAEEYITYGRPAFRLDKRPLVAYGAAANHCALYPMTASVVDAYEAELAGYDTSPGTIRFQPDEPLPAALVRRLVGFRIAELRGSSADGPD